MAKTFAPPYPQSPKLDGAVLAAANTARDGSGSITTICTVGSDDGVVKRIRFVPAQLTAAAFAAKVACLFYSTDGGTTWNFLDDRGMATVTPSTTVATGVGQAVFSFPDLLGLQASYKLGATITVYGSAADRTQVIVERADY